MKNNEIYGAGIVDLALVIGNNLIISDLHLGYEEALNAEGRVSNQRVIFIQFISVIKCYTCS